MENEWNIWHELALAFYVEKNGGFRERDIYSHPHYIKQGCAWNDEHKVVDVVSKYMDDDGHQDSFSVDLVTGRICG